MMKTKPIGTVLVREVEESLLFDKKCSDEYKIIELLKNQKNVIVFGHVQSGKTNKIFNLARIAREGDYDVVILFGGSSNCLLNQTKRSASLELKSNDPNFLFLNNGLNNVDISQSLIEGEKIFINIMKEDSHLEMLKRKFFNTSSKSKKILLIDDESDFASVNTSKTKSKVYKLISEMKMHSDNLDYCMFTATPYANIVNSKSELLKPDVLFFLNNNENYTGIEYFNKNNYVFKQISNVDENYTNIYTALKYFIYNSAIYKNIDDNKKFEFVINISIGTDDHKIYKEIYEKIIKDINYDLNESIFEESFYEQIDNAKSCKILNLDRKTIISNCVYVFNQICDYDNVIILNSNNNIYESDGSNYKIIIGGNLISRGFAFKHLLVEIMLNIPKNKISADTHAQRARWLGYRKEYFNYMKIFISERGMNAYSEIEQLNKLIYNKSNASTLKIDNSLVDELKKLKFKYIKITGGPKSV